MARYNIDEFLGGTPKPETKDKIISKKISLLYDFCVMKRNRETEKEVREFLSNYATEEQMSRALHNVIRGTETLDHLLHH